MGATYTRQSSYTDGDIITAAHTNDEFNQLLAAFVASTGHTHDGTTGEGGPITKMLGTSLTLGDGTAGTDITVTFDGETNDGVLKWMEDEDYFEFSDDILIASTEKLQFRDTAIYINSSSDGQLDIVADTEVQIAATTIDINGDADVSGTLTYGSLSDGSITITAFVDEDDMSSDSATLVPTQQAVKAYVDAQVTAQDLDFQADTGGALNIDLDSETLTLTGGTGIDTSGSGNAVTFAIDSTVATLTGTQTLTNKTIDVDNNTVSNIEVDNLKSGVLDTDLSSVSASDDTLASAKAIKTYVDSQVTAQDLDFQGDSGGALSIDLDSETLDIAGGTGISTSGSSNTITITLDNTAVSAGSYGSSTAIPVITVDAQGRLTSASTASISSTMDIAGDSGTDSILVGTDTFTIAGGTGLSSTATTDTITLNIGSTVVTLAGSHTLTHKTLTTPVISSISNTGTLTLPTSTDTLVGRDTTDTLTNKTLTSAELTSPVLNGSLSGTAFLDEDTMSSDSATAVASQQSIKAYVDSQISSSNELDELTDVSITSVADKNILVYDSVSGNWENQLISGDVSITNTGVATVANSAITSAKIADGTIVNADVNASAAIDATKIHDGSISNTEFGYLNGVTSNIQTQLTSLDTLKAPLASPTFTGTVSAPTPTTGDSSTKVATTAFVTNAVAVENELAEMNDVDITSVADADFLVYDSTATKWENQAISGAVTISNTGVATLSSGVDATKISNGSVDSTEFQYLDGVTSSIQTQIDSKQNTIDASARLNANLVG